MKYEKHYKERNEIREFILSRLVTENSEHVNILLETRELALLGFGRNTLTLKEVGKLTGVSVERARGIEGRLRRRMINELRKIAAREAAYLNIEETRLKNISAVPIAVALPDLSARASKILRVEGIKTVGQLTSHRYVDLLRIPTCGRVTISEIQRALAAIGLKLTPEDWEVSL